MATEDSNKRIKLNLEPSLDRLPFDITQKAEEIYLPDGNACEKLKRKIKVISDAAGDHYDRYTDNVASVKEPAEGSAVATTAGTDGFNVQDQPAGGVTAASAATATNARVTSPQGIYAKLWHAQSEIGIALDVLNIIISSFQSPSGAIGSGSNFPSNAPPTALPPGSLKCEHVPKPILVSAQIQNEKLALGAKRQQLRNAADILIQGAQKLRGVMVDEDQFWAGALRLRKNNWCLVSGRSGQPGYNQQGFQLHPPHGSRQGTGSHLFVHYGFRDVGSLYGERAYAELARNPSSRDDSPGIARSIELHIPNKSGKVLIMSLMQQGAVYIQGPKEAKGRRANTLHTQLLEAQDSLFDGELFHELVNEARTMTGCVSIVDNEILLSVNEELELRIAYRCATTDDLLSGSLPKSDFAKRHQGIADVLCCAIQLTQHRRFRQNIKERSDSFFKSSRPGGGRAAGTYGQIQQTLQHRPTAMLSMMLQALQYFTFSKRVRDVLTRSTRNLRQSWWEAIQLQSVDIKSPPPSLITSGCGNGSAGAQAALLLNSTAASPFRNVSNYGMGLAVSIRVGMKAPPIRFVIRSHPLPCVVLQLSDRPAAPMAHIAEFEKVLEQELASRAIGRICDVLNSINDWSELTPRLQSPRFVIDIEQHCVGVFAVPQQRDDVGKCKSSHIHLVVDIKADRAISITIICNQDRFRSKRIFLEDQPLQGGATQPFSGADGPHPHDVVTIGATSDTGRRTMETFRSWLQQNILAELDF
ncbi:RNA polymerase II mediator complex subunit [Linnemannia schmuckeri]|uniref:Mediator of RNA polymerase II transcription subunit 17 n=1 Tax=Linnemannia schmuckeri TaxID=64567 RepID=A0A9P5S809_9FUNG|nr:RNA polymerase II mediator complex subunit [Linnemannia schmuckeri]